MIFAKLQIKTQKRQKNEFIIQRVKMLIINALKNKKVTNCFFRCFLAHFSSHIGFDELVKVRAKPNLSC